METEKSDKSVVLGDNQQGQSHTSRKFRRRQQQFC